MKRRLARLITGTGRRVRPPTWSVAAVLIVVAGLAAAAFGAHRWATAVEPPATTLAAAGVLLDRPLRLDAAREVAWRHALGEARAVPDAWRELLAPPLPPALCAAQPVAVATELVGARIAPPAPSELAELDEAIRGVDDAIARGATAAELEKRIQALRDTGPYEARGRSEFIVRYNLARAYQAAGDLPAAAQLIEPVFDGYLNGDRVPVSNSGAAARLLERGRIDAATAAEAFHARFLAGAIAYGRSEMATAIKHFRLGINAVNYLVAAESGPDAPAHYERVRVAAPGACRTGRAREELTSLDAYAGLVAAYMAAAEFRDPTRLAPELRRSRLEIDPGDPFQPVLRYARRPSRERSDIPENLLWAASNLQRVYHHNRLDPDARLEVTRAALLLRLTNTPDWTMALTRGGEGEVCGMLGAVAEQLLASAAARPVAGPAPGPVDSARAAAALLTYSRLAADEGCAAPAVPAEVKSVWLIEGGGGQRGPLAARFEARRAELEAVVRGAGDERVLAARAADVLEAARADERRFNDGRIPADLPATLEATDAARLSRRWRFAVFEDVAVALASLAAPAGRTASAGGAVPLPAATIPAGRAAQYIAALDAAIIHAGGRPSDYYASADLATLARANGLAGYTAYRVRYAARNDPGGAAVLLGAAFLMLAALTVLLHVGFWRYRLLTRSRLYAAEAARRDSWPA